MPEMMLPCFRVEVKSTDGTRQQTLIIPSTGDVVYDKELVEAYVEKTIAELDSKPPRPKSKLSREEIKIGIREVRDFLKHRRENVNPKYF